jgi:glucokinase
VAISNSGRLPELLSAVDKARAAGADVIAISSSQSPLAKRASVVLAVDHAEDNTSFLSMISRVLQLLLIDIMAVGVSVDVHQTRPATASSPPTQALISHLDS